MPSTSFPSDVLIKGNVEIEEEVQVGRGTTIEGTEDQSTYIRWGCEIGEHCHIFPGTNLGERSKVGDLVTLGHPAKLDITGRDVTLESPRVADLLVHSPGILIGPESIIRSQSILYSRVSTGRIITGHGTIIREHTSLDDNCVIGTRALLDGYIRIGKRSQIQSHCYVAQSVRIGNFVFMGPQCTFLDNKRIILKVEEDLFGATIEDYVRVGGGSIILPNVVIGRGAFIGSGSIVSKSVRPYALALGCPARESRLLSMEEFSEYRASIDPQMS